MCYWWIGRLVKGFGFCDVFGRYISFNVIDKVFVDMVSLFNGGVVFEKDNSCDDG